LRPISDKNSAVDDVIPLKKQVQPAPKKSIEDAPSVDIRNMLNKKPEPAELVAEADDLPPLEDVE
jgi:hypothetical protein